MLYIDIDGEGSYPPFLVYCNMEAFGHVGIIEIPTDKCVDALPASLLLYIVLVFFPPVFCFLVWCCLSFLLL